MHIRYRGWIKDLDCLPDYEKYQGATKFKEPETITQLSKVLIWYSGGTFLFTLMAMGLGIFLGPNRDNFSHFFYGRAFLGFVCFLLMIVPHEAIHACFYGKSGEGNMYIGPGFACMTTGKLISKGRFILMCLAPTLILGGIPLVIWATVPLSAFSCSFFIVYIPLTLLGGAGDFMNVVNTILQVPAGGYVQQSGMHSYWYDKVYGTRKEKII